MKIKNKRWWDIPAAVFLSAALICASARLQTTGWTENLGRVGVIVILAAALGFALGKSMFNGRTTFIMGLVYSLFFIPWQLGLLLPDMDWISRLNILYARMWYATADFIQNNPVKDPILFLATMIILFWFASLLATYRLVRRANPWVPLLSLGGMILVIEYTVEMYRTVSAPGSIYSLFYLIFCLLLLGRLYFLRSRQEWEERGGTVEMEVGYDLGRGVVVAAIAVSLLAWNTPRIINFFDYRDPARERVSQGWQTFRDRISKAANSLRSSSPAAVQSYGNNMFLGTGGSQSEVLQFTVKPETGHQPIRMYWAAHVYDQYQAGQWESTVGSTQDLGPGNSPLKYNWSMRRNVQFTFFSQIPFLKTLFFVSEPISISRPSQGVVSKAQEGTEEISTIVTEPPLKAGEQYSVLAEVPQPTVLALQGAGTQYPDWIKQRYLEMPANFSPRVVELARQIAGEEKTPYDQAMAVTQYLRRTITYSLTIPDTPRNREPIEWFLFDLRSGFCNYYASAEVMMLRSLGVPARLVVGYAEGTWNPEQNEYQVLGKDSHAWPEVYFPNIGWVIFEPTVSQPLNNYPQGSPSDANASSNSLPIPQPTFNPGSATDLEHRQPLGGKGLQSSPASRIFTPVTITVTVVVLLIVTLVILETRRRRIEDLPLPSWLEKVFDERGLRTPDWLRMWSRRALRTPMENLFANVSLMLRVWGQKIDPAQTPAEQVAVLIKVVPSVKDQAITLLDEYHRAMYSQYPANLSRAKLAVSQIRSIGYRSWIMRLVGLES